MKPEALYRPSYGQSHALVIGINEYRHVSPLERARKDAEGIAEMLITGFGFPEANVTLLTDVQATREVILRAFLHYADASLVGSDDRILIFFAGHGHTVPGRRGETGFLIPSDGRIDDLFTLLRWDDLTRNADLIPAKHMLFLMDACYGGLAFNRAAIPAGSSRFLKDMLQRYARQVLTAGKADEPVSDGGGTRIGHSIFTSHLLDGMEGAAAPGDHVLTGNALMAYVYNRVGKDTYSHQTPHFGYLDGDGDFIFDLSALMRVEKNAASQPEADVDVVIEPSPFLPAREESEPLSATLKTLVSGSSRIALDDLISKLLRTTVAELGVDKFPTSVPLSSEEFALRLERYENAVFDLAKAVIILAHWGEPQQISLIEKIFARVAEAGKATEGVAAWLRLEWYPSLILMYTTGISSLSSRNYHAPRCIVDGSAFRTDL
jgi:uncharacterized caspase-like protein